MNLVNKEINKLNGRKNSSIELFEDVILAEGEPVPFELVSQVMKKFGHVFKESSTRQQRKQLLNLLVSKVTIDKSREIDTIELQINEGVIRCLVKEGSSE